MLLETAPLIALYELSILLARKFDRSAGAALGDAPAATG
jgi:Sec-independent protein secretion pathway component TatC